MRWAAQAIIFFSLVCSALSAGEEPSLKIMARSSVYNVGEKKGIYCEGTNIDEPIEWYMPSGDKVEGKSTKNTRVYVERRTTEPNLLALIIQSTKMKDSGNWTCKSGDLSQMLEIIVGEKVTLREENQKLTAEEGKTAKLECEGKGNPQPVIQWYMDGRAIEEDPNKYVMKKKGDTYTLEIKHLTHEDAGDYICKLTQKALTHYALKTINLSVHHKPILFNHETKELYPTSTSPAKYREEEVFAVYNETKKITCAAVANPKATFRWYRRKNNFDEPIREEDTIFPSEDGVTSTMILRMRDESDTGQYKCTASNSKGSVTVIYDVTPGAKPEAPTEITNTTSNSTYIAFSVSCLNCTFYNTSEEGPDPNSLPVIKYSFQLVPAQPGFLPDWEAAEEFTVDIVDSKDNIFYVGPLPLNGTEYHVRVRSVNIAGPSDWLEMVTTASTAYATRFIASLSLLIAAYIFTIWF